jgi:hypothetical protein
MTPTAHTVTALTPCCDKAGDANNDTKINVGDPVFLIHIFKGGANPPCMQEGDANADGYVNVADVVYMLNLVFAGGPAAICGPETPPGPIPSSDSCRLYWDAIRTSSGAVVDTLIAGQSYAFQLGIENSTKLRGMGFGFRFFSPDGATSHWQMVPGWTYKINYTIVPGCRMEPMSTVWDFGFFFTEYEVNDILPERIVIGGVSNYGGMSTGPGQGMIKIPFTPDSVASGLRRLCIDSSAGDYGNGADFVFADIAGHGPCPVLEWPVGGRCWYVRNPVGFAGDANVDGLTNVADVVYLINYIFKDGPAPNPFTNGDANCDGLDNVGDCVYLINFIFKSGPKPCPI